MSTENNKPAKAMNENKFEIILGRIVDMEETGVQFPKNYSPENALRSAWLILQETQTMSKQPVLEACTNESIANAVLKMTVAGLNPMKKQCYFIAYGNKLECQTSYQGNISIAKRHGLKDCPANVIHEGEEFNYEIDSNGYTKITSHKPTFESLSKPIIGAYAVVNMIDGTSNAEIMTIEDIKEAWRQGATKGNSPAHQRFDGEMCKKTVINRALKTIINSSDDAGLFNLDEAPKQTPTEAYVSHQIEANANKKEIGFEEEVQDAEEVTADEPEKERELEAVEQGQQSMPNF